MSEYCDECRYPIDAMSIALYNERFGAMNEQQRIIRLLEEQGCLCIYNPDPDNCVVHEFIALIKGEVLSERG